MAGRVLIADDSAFARTTLRELMSSRGYAVVAEAASAAEAVSLYKILRPDIVTMDLSMPGLTGLDAILALRELDARCKVILITAVQDDPIVKGLAALGVPVVAKPVRWESLEEGLVACAAGHSRAL
jgi:two-component system, chemotaxis family, chemotaxis protein CheY